MAEEEGSSRPRDQPPTGVHEGDGRQAADTGDGGGRGAEDISDTPAPSVGSRTVFKRERPEERLARHDQSDVDAMGHDKRRQVVGKTYGPTIARQALLYIAFIIVVVAIGFGVKLLVDHYDQPPKHFAAEAPWAQKGAKQIKPKRLQ
jgi:hypothetical protein